MQVASRARGSVCDLHLTNAGSEFESHGKRRGHVTVAQRPYRLCHDCDVRGVEQHDFRRFDKQRFHSTSHRILKKENLSSDVKSNIVGLACLWFSLHHSRTFSLSSSCLEVSLSRRPPRVPPLFDRQPITQRSSDLGGSAECTGGESCNLCFFLLSDWFFSCQSKVFFLQCLHIWNSSESTEAKTKHWEGKNYVMVLLRWKKSFDRFTATKKTKFEGKTETLNFDRFAMRCKTIKMSVFIFFEMKRTWGFQNETWSFLLTWKKLHDCFYWEKKNLITDWRNSLLKAKKPQRLSSRSGTLTPAFPPTERGRRS